MVRHLIWIILALPSVAQGETTEFCLTGEFDLGARNQGLTPGAGQWYPTRWCVVSESDSDRVLFSAEGMANADMEDTWTVAYLPPDVVRIVNRDEPPDVEFVGADAVTDEARRVRRLDPRRLLAEFAADPDAFRERSGLTLEGIDDEHVQISTSAELPLRGRVPVKWEWDLSEAEAPRALLAVSGRALFRGTGRWRTLGEAESEAIWKRTPGEEPIQPPGDAWPSTVNTRLVNLTDDLYLAQGVRTGFQHIVIETDDGLVIGDAPAGWVEFHHLPPSDLVPGLGVSGLSERFVDFLIDEFPGRSIHAVAITHAHDDHAGGARAFAAAGAEVYAPAAVAGFLEHSLNTADWGQFGYSTDRLGTQTFEVVPVDEFADIADGVRLISIGSGPHASAMIGVLAVERGYFFVSDIHVPYGDEPAPREDRKRTECWFAEWAVANLPSEVRVVNSHSSVVTPVSRLAEYLESDGCRHLSN